MKALIMAGGYSRRLRPITNNLPKCLLLIAGKPIINHQIDALRSAGISEIVVVTGFQANLLRQHLVSHYPRIHFTFIDNPLFAETKPSFGLWLARDHLNGPTLYTNADLVCEKKLFRDVIKHPQKTVTAVSRREWDEEQAKVMVDGMTVKKLGKNIPEEESGGEFLGIAKMDSDFTARLKKVLETWGESQSRNRFAIEALSETINQGGVMEVFDASPYKGMEVDTLEDYKTAQKLWKKPALKKIPTLLQIAKARILRTISYVIPRNKNLVVYYGWHGGPDRELFADNSKYLFLWTSANLKEKTSVWLGMDENVATILQQAGLKSFSKHSLRGMWCGMRAKYVFIDALMTRDTWQLSGGAYVTQLWHGKGMKKTGYEGKYSLGRYSKLLYPELFTQYKKAIATSPYTAELMSKTFRIPIEHVLITGLPRNDVLKGEVINSKIDSDATLEDILRTPTFSQSKKVILYAPTFRPDGSNPFGQIDFEKLDVILEEKNECLIASAHPKFAKRDDLYSLPLKRIRFIEAGLDIYPHLNKFSMLITDYSSLYVDFLLLNKPILFFVYDIDEYDARSGLNKDFYTHAPGPHIKTSEELFSAISSEEDGKWKKEREGAIDIFHTHTDGGASQRVAESVGLIKEEISLS